MTVPVTENDPLGALTPPANHQSPTNKGLVKSATCPNNDLYNVGNNRAKTPVKTGEFFFFLPSSEIGCQKETTVALLVVLEVNNFGGFLQQPSALGLHSETGQIVFETLNFTQGLTLIPTTENS